MKKITITVCMVMLSAALSFGRTGIKKGHVMVIKKNSDICCLATAMGMMNSIFNYTSTQEHLCIEPQSTAQGIIYCNNFWGDMFSLGVSYVELWLTYCESINGSSGCGSGVPVQI